MATTTPNFGWSVPTSTDLVKDGATAIETLGDAIDASLVDLKGGTTGQVLAKNSNSDMDFVWSADASGIPATIFDAKGDLIAASAADTAARLAVGTNGQVLTADSTAATGLKWATAGATGTIKQIVTAVYSTQVTTTSATPVDTGLSATITPTSASSTILVMTSQNYSAYINTSGQIGTVSRLVRGSTTIVDDVTVLYGVYSAGSGGSELRMTVQTGFIKHDSPATTSAVTYKTQFNQRNSVTSYVQKDGAATMTLIEIGAL